MNTIPWLKNLIPQNKQTTRAYRTDRLLATIFLFVGLLTTAATTFAELPYSPNMVTGGNKWSFRAFDDGSKVHTKLANAQGMCFEYAGVAGDHQLYTWYSDTFPGWRGKAVQEGDNIFIHGEFAGTLGHTSIQIEALSPPPAYASPGTWQEWRHNGANGTTVYFAKTRAVREGDCSISAEEAAKLPPLLTGNPVSTDLE